MHGNLISSEHGLCIWINKPYSDEMRCLCIFQAVIWSHFLMVTNHKIHTKDVNIQLLLNSSNKPIEHKNLGLSVLFCFDPSATLTSTWLFYQQSVCGCNVSKTSIENVTCVFFYDGFLSTTWTLKIPKRTKIWCPILIPVILLSKL